MIGKPQNSGASESDAKILADAFERRVRRRQDEELKKRSDIFPETDQRRARIPKGVHHPFVQSYFYHVYAGTKGFKFSEQEGLGGLPKTYENSKKFITDRRTIAERFASKQLLREGESDVATAELRQARFGLKRHHLTGMAPPLPFVGKLGHVPNECGQASQTRGIRGQYPAQPPASRVEIFVSGRSLPLAQVPSGCGVVIVLSERGSEGRMTYINQTELARPQSSIDFMTGFELNQWVGNNLWLNFSAYAMERKAKSPTIGVGPLAGVSEEVESIEEEQQQQQHQQEDKKKKRRVKILLGTATVSLADLLSAEQVDFPLKTVDGVDIPSAFFSVRSGISDESRDQPTGIPSSSDHAIPVHQDLHLLVHPSSPFPWSACLINLVAVEHDGSARMIGRSQRLVTTTKLEVVEVVVGQTAAPAIASTTTTTTTTITSSTTPAATAATASTSSASTSSPIATTTPTSKLVSSESKGPEAASPANSSGSAAVDAKFTFVPSHRYRHIEFHLHIPRRAESPSTSSDVGVSPAAGSGFPSELVAITGVSVESLQGSIGRSFMLTLLHPEGLDPFPIPQDLPSDASPKGLETEAPGLIVTVEH